MNLAAVAINHHTAPVNIREAFHLSSDEIAAYINKIKDTLFSEGLVISTCNRTDVYGIPVKQDITFKEIQDSLIEFKSGAGIKQENFENLRSAEALKHLFSVICGIDSLMIGDNQVYSQVKDSFIIAENCHFTGTIMKRVYELALKTGKRAISETSINEGAVTISFAAVQLIEKIFSSLNKKSALVIGTGETGEIAARHLSERGIGSLTLSNRTFEKAANLAEMINAFTVPFEELKKDLNKYDIIISATSSPDIIISKEDIAAAMKKRNYASMVVMDIAIPRDIDSKCGEIDYVFYHDIDNLNVIVEQNVRRRKDEIPKVQSIIEEELQGLLDWYNSLEAGPTIKTLRDLFEAVRAEEVKNNINRFSDDDRDKLEIVTKRIINKLLHHPTVELKKILLENDRSETVQKISLIRSLFGLDNTNKKEE
jgi:glutamyl-tRNA reductase